MEYEIIHDDSMEVLTRMTDDSIDAIVADGPYGLKFMGKKWDYDVPSVALWKECLRVLKPGGYVLSFASARTYHRMAVNIEDAGFEIRDQIMWLYGSGFPKSLNASKAIDSHLMTGGSSPKQMADARAESGQAVEEGKDFRNHSYRKEADSKQGVYRNKPGTAGKWEPQTPQAAEWQGWGTALKPSHEPIVMARKPLIGTVAKNVLEHGTGALNIDASRIDYKGEKPNIGGRGAHTRGDGYGFKALGDDLEANPTGRWPANIIHDGIEDEWARYFYCPKASKAERGEGNDHPTVKPVALMEYLVRLVTPPGGVVLDPFLGSGTTGVAAIRLGFDFIGIEREADYIPIAEARMAHANDEIIVVKDIEAEWV